MTKLRIMTLGKKLMEEVPATALMMHEGMPDRRWQFDRGWIILAYQQENDGPTWWIRRTTILHTPVESHWCRNIFHLISATALILENAGIEI
jgi:hypothetical protein